MKLAIKSIKGEKTKELELPKQFKELLRPDLIKRAVLVIQANKRQPYGANEDAGKKHVTKLSRRRHDYKGSYGHGISRVPRKIMSRNGTRMNWTGALAPGTVGGRRAHPPKATKIWAQKINIKERRKAIRSALSATINKELVEKRGHKIPKDYPFILENKAEDIQKTKDVIEMLVSLGFEDELLRCDDKTIRAGRGKTRGRKYKIKSGPLLVVSKDSKLSKSARNIQGVDIVRVDNINTELLAPGTTPGRLTIYTEDAIKRIKEENLFI